MDVILSVARNKRGVLEEAIKVRRGNEETIRVGGGVETGVYTVWISGVGYTGKSIFKMLLLMTACLVSCKIINQ